MLAVYPTAVPTCAVLAAGVRTILAAPFDVTVKLAVALVNPAALAVTVALPSVVGVKLETATPAVGLTGDAGLNEPPTPATAKLIALVAVPTVLPFAS